MVAKKSTSTPQWGNKAAEPEQQPEPATPTPTTEPMDPDDIPAFLRRGKDAPIDNTPAPGQSPEEATRAAQVAERATHSPEPVQTDLEDFTSSPALSPAGEASASLSADEEAPQQSDAAPAPQSGAVAEPPHDPEPGEVTEESTQTSDAEWEAAAPQQHVPAPEPGSPEATEEVAGPAPKGGDGRELKPDDNQPRPATVVDADGTVAGKQLFSFIERYERLDEEKKALADDQKEVLAEAKGNGFDTATIRRLIALRKLDPEVRQERESMLDLYKSAIGME